MEASVIHETSTRLRLRVAPGADLSDARVSLEVLAGVVSARASPQTRSLTVVYDGRAPTRQALLERLGAQPRRRLDADELPRRSGEALSIAASGLAAALTPLLPRAMRPPVALALVAVHAVAEWRQGTHPTATALDALALAGSALTGHPLTATTSVLLAGIAERRRAHVLARTDRLLSHLASAPHADHARAERLRAHVRHALRSRDAPGALTPDLERLLALPVTAAGLVLALTGDAARSAAMLQADPQMGIALAQPVAREAALYAVARHGALMSGLDSIERLASATTVAFEDVGVLAEARWRVERVELLSHDATEQQVRRWLAMLAGHGDTSLLETGLHDDQVALWRAHGAVLHDAPYVLHIGGAALLERTWKLPLPEPDRRSLVRRLGIVDHGRLLAAVYLGCRLRSGVAAQFERLRADGVRRIAVFSEDAGAQPAAALMEVGADAVVYENRAAQQQWLADAVARGERVALVHTGLRELLPPGGLSLCPVDAEAGAHGVLLGEPLPSLIAARVLARRIRRELRWRFGRSVALNAALMTASALRLLPPWSTALLKHGAALLLLEESAGLAQLRGEGIDVQQPSQH